MGRVSSMQKKIDALERQVASLQTQIGDLVKAHAKEIVDIKQAAKELPKRTKGE